MSSNRPSIRVVRSRFFRLDGLALLCVLGWCASLKAEEQILKTPESFLEEAFGDSVPSKRFIWITGSVRDATVRILGHRYGQLRVGYWRAAGRTVWILEEIGKVKPITAGFLVVSGKIENFEVLVYRESHGWEIRYPFFTRQFRGAELDERQQLTRSIDGISGATLSVNAVTRLTRLALFLDGATEQPEAAK